MNIPLENAGRPTGESRSQSPLAPPSAVKRSQTNPPLSQHRITQNNLRPSVPQAASQSTRASLAGAGQSFRISMGSQPADSGGGQPGSFTRTLTSPDRRKKMHTYAKGDCQPSPSLLSFAATTMDRRPRRAEAPRCEAVPSSYTPALAKQAPTCSMFGHDATAPQPLRGSCEAAIPREPFGRVSAQSLWRDPNVAAAQPVDPVAPRPSLRAQFSPPVVPPPLNPPMPTVNYFGSHRAQPPPLRERNELVMMPGISPLSSYQNSNSSNAPWASNGGAMYRGGLYGGMSLPQPPNNPANIALPAASPSADGTTRSFDSAPCGVAGAFRRAPNAINFAPGMLPRTASCQYGSVTSHANVRFPIQQPAPMSSRPSLTTRGVLPPIEHSLSQQSSLPVPSQQTFARQLYEPASRSSGPAPAGPAQPVICHWNNSGPPPAPKLTSSTMPPASTEHRYILQAPMLRPQTSFERSAEPGRGPNRVMRSFQPATGGAPQFAAHVISTGPVAGDSRLRQQPVPQQPPSMVDPVNLLPGRTGVAPAMRSTEDYGSAAAYGPRPPAASRWQRYGYNANSEGPGAMSGFNIGEGLGGVEDDDCLSSEHRIINQVLKDQGITVEW